MSVCSRICSKRVIFTIVFLGLLFFGVEFLEAGSNSEDIRISPSEASNAAQPTTCPGSDSGQISLSFPLRSYNAYTAPVVTVFDHAMSTPYCPGGGIVAYTGELGTQIDYQEFPPAKPNRGCPTKGSLWSFLSPNGHSFKINGNYVGTNLTGSGTLNYDGHSGYDYGVGINTEVLAAADGEVTFVNNADTGSNGRYIVIDHPKRGGAYQTLYLHLQKIYVDTSTKKCVTRGMVIGLSGNSGNVSAHLHFEVKKNGHPVDPYGWTGNGNDPYIYPGENLWGDTSSGSAPVISSVSPSPVLGSESLQEFDIQGLNFAPGANIILKNITTGWPFPYQRPTSFSSTRIALSFDFTISESAWSVEVINPDGRTTGPFEFKVIAPFCRAPRKVAASSQSQECPVPAPTISSVSPNPLIGSNTPQLLTLAGQNFATGANIVLRDITSGREIDRKAPLSFSSSQIVLQHNFTTDQASWSVEVINPGGQTTGQFPFQVLAPGNRGPAPVINSVYPNPVPGLNARQPFTLTGNNFVSGANVILRDLTAGQEFPHRLASSFSGTQIVLSSDFTTAEDLWSVEVINPDGQSSGQLKFRVVSTPTSPPSVSSVLPSPVIGSNSAQSLTIIGSNFVSGANITLRDLSAGQTFPSRPISSLSGTQIVLNATFTTEAHTWSVEVINPDGQSSGQYQFQVQSPVASSPPLISGVYPNPVTGSSSAQPFTIYGSNFVSGANVTLRDLTAGQTFPNRTAGSFTSTQIVLNPNFTTAAHTWSVEVINPDGQSSGQYQFQVQSPVVYPAPAINSVSPNPVTGSNSSQPFTIYGSNFVSGASVTLRDLSAGQIFPNRPANSFSSTQIVLTPTFTTAAHLWSVEVINPDGQSSGQYQFQVQSPTSSLPPSISSVYPNPVTGSNSSQPFTIYGSSFVSGANVTLRDLSAGQTFPNRTASSFSSTQIVLNPNFTTAAHTWSVEVINPDGQSSGQYQFQVQSPTDSLPPSISSVYPNPVTGSNSSQPFTIYGSSFVSGANVTLRDLSAGQTFPSRTASSFSSTQIVLNPTFTTAAHLWSVEVINPDGQSSGQYQFQVQSPTGSLPPSISSVSPNPVTGSNSSQPFTIYGSNFVSGANVTLRDLSAGQTFPNRTASSFSNTQIVLNPTFTTAAHLWSVEVINPDGQSSGQYQFQVQSPTVSSPPSISSVSPNPVTGSNSSQPFTIYGSNFVSGANVTLRDLSAGQTFPNRTASSFSSTQIVLNPNFTTAAHTWSVEVINPDGQSSGQYQFQVQSPVVSSPPSINSVSPNPVTGSNSSQPFTIYGSNFVSGANVTLRDLSAGQTFPNRTASSFSSTQIVLNPTFTTAAHTWSVEVINPDGQSSGQYQFQVQSPVVSSPPSINSVSPNPVTGSNSSQPFTIFGSNFISGANVTLRDLSAGQTFPNRTASSFSSTQIVLNPTFTTAAHTWSVEVINPDGQSSGQYQFQVQSPVVSSPPSINSVSPNPVTGSNSSQPFTIYGSNFVSGANVTLRDLSAGQTFPNRTASSFSSTQIVLNPNFTTAAHTWSVEVINPDGQSSGQYQFQVH